MPNAFIEFEVQLRAASAVETQRRIFTSEHTRAASAISRADDGSGSLTRTMRDRLGACMRLSRSEFKYPGEQIDKSRVSMTCRFEGDTGFAHHVRPRQGDDANFRIVNPAAQFRQDVLAADQRRLRKRADPLERFPAIAPGAKGSRVEKGQAKIRQVINHRCERPRSDNTRTNVLILHTVQDRITNWFCCWIVRSRFVNRT